MALDLDGAAVLRSIVEDPSAFPDIATELNKVARALVAKQLKAKSATLERVRRVQGAVGGPAFRLVIDGLSDAEVKSLAGRLDRNHPDITAGTADWRRRHIVTLASGADPAPKPQKPKAPGKKASAPARPKPRRALGSKAMAAVWDGKDRDD